MCVDLGVVAQSDLVCDGIVVHLKPDGRLDLECADPSKAL